MSNLGTNSAHKSIEKAAHGSQTI